MPGSRMTPPSLTDVDARRLGAEFMKARALGLRDAYASTRTRLESQERSVLRLRAEIAALRAS